MLVANDIEGLNAVTSRQRELLVESRILNKKRENLTEEIKAANMIEGDLSVTRLLEFVDENQSERLIRLKDIILDLNDRITESRNTNAMLLNQSREFIAKTMEMLSKIHTPDNTYSRQGVNATDGSNIVIDRRV